MIWVCLERANKPAEFIGNDIVVVLKGNAFRIRITFVKYLALTDANQLFGMILRTIGHQYPEKVKHLNQALQAISDVAAVQHLPPQPS